MIQLRDISKAYGSQQALSNITLNIEKGHIVTLLGSSGCGKTTTLRLIAGLERPDQGDILIAGRKVSTSRVLVSPNKRGIGMVFQDLALWPHMTVQENVEFPLEAKLRSHAKRLREVADILDLVRLSSKGKKYPSELSGGEQQRVALARALVVQPGILLFDEPMANLDPLLKTEIIDVLLELHKQLGFTLVYVTHNLAEVVRLNSVVVLMRAGKIEQKGSLEEIRKDPRTEYVKRFVAQ